LFIDTPSQMTDFMEHVHKAAVVGVDTEFISGVYYVPKLQLVQVDGLSLNRAAEPFF
jgi:ribonuclease D